MILDPLQATSRQLFDHNSKCRGPFYMIFGCVEALGFLYLLTGFLTLNPSGKRENKEKEVYRNCSNKTEIKHAYFNVNIEGGGG